VSRLPIGSNPIAELNDAVHVVDGRLIVGGNDHGSPITGSIREEIENLAPGFGIKLARWFVGNHDVRIGCKGTSNSDTLLFSTAQFRWRVHDAVAKTNFLKECSGSSAALRFRDAQFDEREGDVGAGGQPGEKMEALEDNADARETEVGAFPIGERCCIGAGNVNCSGGWDIKGSEEMEERGFAAATRATHANEFTGRDS
jgi:hypothetical protein